MATTTPQQALPIPQESDVPDVPVAMSNLANAVEKRLMGVYASPTDRDAKITSPQKGQFAFCSDTNLVWFYNGTAWAQFPPVAPTIYNGSTVPSNSLGNNGDIYFKV